MTQESTKTASLALNPFQQALMDELEKYRHQKFIGKSLKEATDQLETAIKQSSNPEQIISLIETLSTYQEKPKVKKANPTKGLLKKNFAQHEIKFDTLINNLFDKVALEFNGGKGHKALAEQHKQITVQLADLSTAVQDKQTMLIQALLQDQKLENMLNALQASAQAPHEISAIEKLQSMLSNQESSKLSSADIETIKSSIGTLIILIRTELVNKTDVDPTIKESANKLYEMSQLIGHINGLTGQYNSGSYETCKNEIAALNELFDTMEDTQELKQKTKSLESSMTVFFDVKHKILEQCFLSQIEKLSDFISAGKENLQPTYPFYNQLSRAEELIKYGYYMDAVDLLIKINPQDVKNPEIQTIIATIKEKADLLYNTLSVDERTHIKKIQQDPTDTPKINWLNALNTDNPKDPSHKTFFSECQNANQQKLRQLSKTLDTIIDYAKNHPNPQVREAALKALEKIIKESQNDTVASNAVRQVVFEQYQNSQNKPFLNDLKIYFNGCSLDADILDHLCVGFKNPLTLKKDESIKYTKQELEGLAIPIMFNIGIATIFAQIEKQYNSIAKEDDKKNYLAQSSKFIDAMITSAQSNPELIAKIESGITQFLQTIQVAAPDDVSKYNERFNQNIEAARANNAKIASIATRSQATDGEQQLAGLAQTAKGNVAHVKAKQLADDLLVGYIHHVSQITPMDFHKQKWSKWTEKSGEPRPHLNIAIEHFNALSNMVVADILNATAGLPIDRTLTDQQRQAAIDVSLFYITVVEECLKNKDFESAKAIWSGLKSSAIINMKLFDDKFPGKDRLQKIDILYGNTANFKRLRDEVAKANSSGEIFIASIGSVCTDYTFIDDGNPTRLLNPLDPSKEGPLNPKKMALLANSGFQPLQAMHARLLKHVDTMQLDFQTNLHSHIAASNDLLSQYKELAKSASELEEKITSMLAESDNFLKTEKLEPPDLKQATSIKQRAEIIQQHLAKILERTDLLESTRNSLSRIKVNFDAILIEYDSKAKEANEKSSALAAQISPSTILNVESEQSETSSETIESSLSQMQPAQENEPKKAMMTEAMHSKEDKTKSSLPVKPIGNFTIYSDPIEQLMSGWKQSTTGEQQPYTTKEFDDIATALIFRMPAQDIIDSLAAIRARVQSEDGHLYLATPDDQLNFISQTMMLISSIAKIVPDAFAECKFDALTRDKEPEEYARILNKIPDVIKATAHKIQPIEMTVSQTPLIIDAYLNTKVIHKPETARAVAQDLFRNNLKLMTQIQPEEWVNQNWTRGKSPHIMEMANSFNSLNAMVRQDILFAHSEKHQDRIFRFYIEVLDQALANHDYLSAYAIGASLQDSTISRLTYLGDDKRTAEVMEKFKILSNPNENKKAYNTALMSLENTAHVPNIPFLLQIFTFIDDGNKDKVTIGGLDHTNLDKIGLDGREISRFQKQQAMAQAYLAALPTNKPILTTDIPKRITKPYLDTEEAEKQSFAIKPRGTDTSPTFSQERIDLLQRTIPSMVRLKDALAIHINTTVRGCENINQDPLFKEAKSKEKDLEFIHKINSQGEIELSFKSLTLSHLKTLQGSHFAQLLAKDLKNNGYSISDTDIQAGKIILQGTDVVKFLTAAGVTKADIDLAYKGKGFDPSILNKPPMTPSTLAPTVESEADDEEADELFSVKESDLRQTIDVQPVGVTHILDLEEEQNPSEEEEAKAETRIEGRPRRGDDVSRQPPRPNADILPHSKADEAEETEVRPRAMHPESPPTFVDPALTKRTHILREFAATEESYLKTLSYIADNEKSIHSIVDESTTLSKEQKKNYKEFISILKSIHSANQGILIDLESLRDLYDSTTANTEEIQKVIGQIQEKMKIFVPFYGRHSELLGKVNTPEFLEAFKQVANPKVALSQQESTAKNIDEFLSTQARIPITCASIGITPTQRYPRYRLLTEELLKNTTVAHPAYTATSKLLETILKSTSDIDASVKNRERINNIGQFSAIKADNQKLDSKKSLKIEFAGLPVATSSTTLFEQLKDIQNSGEHSVHFELHKKEDTTKNSIRIYLDPSKEAIATISILRENTTTHPKIVIKTKKNNLSYDALEAINGIANYLEDEFKKSPTFTSKSSELVKLYTLLNNTKAHVVKLASPAIQGSPIAANDPIDPDETKEIQKLAEVLTARYTESKDKSSPHIAILNPDSKSSLIDTPLSSAIDEEPPLRISLENSPVLTGVPKTKVDPIPLGTDPSIISIDEAEEDVVDAETAFDMPSTHSTPPNILPPPLPIEAVEKELQSLEGEALDSAISKHIEKMNAILINQQIPIPAQDASKSTTEIGRLYLDALEAKQKENNNPILKAHIQLLSKILEIQKEKTATLSPEIATHKADKAPPITSRPRAHSMSSSTPSKKSDETLTGRKRAASLSADATKPIWKEPPSSIPSDKPSDKKSGIPTLTQNPSTFTNGSTKAKATRPLRKIVIGEQRIKAQAQAQTETLSSQVVEPHSDAKADSPTVGSQIVEPRTDAKADSPTVSSQVVEPRSDAQVDSPTVSSQSDTKASAKPKSPSTSRREAPLLQQKVGFPPMVSDEFGQTQNLSLQKLHDFAQAHQKAFDIKEIKKFPEQQQEGLKGLEFVFQRDNSDSKPVSAYATAGENQNVKFSVSKSLFTNDQDAAHEAIWKMCRLAVNAAEPNTVFTIPENMSPPEKRDLVKACFERAIQEALAKPDTKFTAETMPKVVDKAAGPQHDTRPGLK